MANRAEDLAAGRLDELGGVLLDRQAEGVVDGDEEPGIAALLAQRLDDGLCLAIGVVDEVDAVGAAVLAGQRRGRGGGGMTIRFFSCAHLH